MCKPRSCWNRSRALSKYSYFFIREHSKQARRKTRLFETLKTNLIPWKQREKTKVTTRRADKVIPMNATQNTSVDSSNPRNQCNAAFLVGPRLLLPALPLTPVPPALPLDFAPLTAAFFVKQVAHNLDRAVLTFRLHNRVLHSGRAQRSLFFTIGQCPERVSAGKQGQPM